MGVICRKLAAVPALVLLTAVAAFGETNAFGNIIDIVADPNASATVTATSPGLQVREVTAVAASSGEYRISTLPQGISEVPYSLDGFQNLKRHDVRLTAGFTARSRLD